MSTLHPWIRCVKIFVMQKWMTNNLISSHSISYNTNFLSCLLFTSILMYPSWFYNFQVTTKRQNKKKISANRQSPLIDTINCCHLLSDAGEWCVRVRKQRDYRPLSTAFRMHLVDSFGYRGLLKNMFMYRIVNLVHAYLRRIFISSQNKKPHTNKHI